jgi:hypothetical protein
MGDVRDALRALMSDGLWDPEWTLVTSVRQYEDTTVLLSRGWGAEVAVSVDKAIPLGATSIKAGADVAVVSGTVQHWTGADKNMTPFYEGLQILPYSGHDETGSAFAIVSAETAWRPNEAEHDEDTEAESAEDIHRST